MIKPTVHLNIPGWLIVCDNCGKRARVFDATARTAYLDVQRYGWRTRTPRDLCPDCSTIPPKG